jgi:Arc/MetJ family transcription regulator
MRTTLDLDDELVKRAQSHSGLRETSALVREALRASINAGWRGCGKASLIWRQRRDGGSITSNLGRYLVSSVYR